MNKLIAVGIAAAALCPLGCGGSSTPSGGTSPSTAPSSAGGPNATPVPVESNIPGDIPDGLAFVGYRNRAGGYRFTHPEGWTEQANGSSVKFTDKLNSVAAEVVQPASTPTVTWARQQEVPRLKSTLPAFTLTSVSSATLPGGSGVLIVFRRNSAPDPVTGRVYRDEVQEYVIAKGGHEVRLFLSGIVGADNVDAYRTMSRSLRV